MSGKNYTYYHGDKALHGYLAAGDAADKPKPAVLIAHDWSGRNAFACHKADMLAAMGYIGFAIDMYGEARLGSTNEEKMALMQPLVSDRGLLRQRIRAAFDALKAMPEVDSQRIAAIGFCFGGLCVLDLARSGAGISGVVSFHGLLSSAKELPNEQIHAKILVLHGYDDPMVKPDDVNQFCQEMTLANVDWQVHQYGHTSHSFTNPEANDSGLGLIYNAVAERRSIQSMANFLQELFA